VYTQNLVFAAPVAVDRERTPADDMRVVVVNSGNANACTGRRGLEDAREMARLAATACGVRAEQALVLSTGVIGQLLPMEKIAAGIAAAAARLADDEPALLAAARGITTTDKSHKLAARSPRWDGCQVQVTGMAKGAGMIGPRMATMLAVILTDAALAPADAQQALTDAVNESFNCMSVEGHMSTNDTVLLLASGQAVERPLEGEPRRAFQAALSEVCVELARAIADDGEGASHLITIDVQGCARREDAHLIAKTVAASPLVKTGVAGNDPNWGRVLSAAGYAGVKFDPSAVQLSMNGFLVYDRGSPASFDRAAVRKSMSDGREVFIELRFSEGDAGVRFWTSDLNTNYVRLNADFLT
jgi:glutamate N-acetyltransferase/amino-acid N-acetyltransferase